MPTRIMLYEDLVVETDNLDPFRTDVTLNTGDVVEVSIMMALELVENAIENSIEEPSDKIVEAINLLRNVVSNLQK